MPRQSFILICTLILLSSFTGEIFFSITSPDPVAVSQDVDAENETEELKEASTLQETMQVPAATTFASVDFGYARSLSVWQNPDIDIQSPPPR